MNMNESDGLWSAADRGDNDRIQELLDTNRDANARNCLGCTPLLYACGSGHLSTVNLLLNQPNVDVNKLNNDRLTSFMLAMQGGPLSGRIPASNDPENNSGNAQERMKRLIDLPATEDLELTRHDRWTALMEACNFGHADIIALLLTVPNLDLEAINLRGQRAEDVAISRGHDRLAEMIRDARTSREHPEELPLIRELENKVRVLKSETRQRLMRSIDEKYVTLREVKSRHEAEIEPLSQRIDSLQEQLDEAMQLRMNMITRQVREIKNVEEEIRQMKKKLDNFDHYASTGNLTSSSLSGLKNDSTTTASTPDLSIFEKDFECSVCLDEMKPPVKIFQCHNGHVMCEDCKSHPEVVVCPSCRIPLNGTSSLLRNIPMEKLARSYYERVGGTASRLKRPSSTSGSRRGSRDGLTLSRFHTTTY